MEQNFWRKCGNCKKEILFGMAYQKCSISSCRKFAYCSVDCWSIHDSVMGHKSAYAEEAKSTVQRSSRRSINSRRKKIIINAKKGQNLLLRVSPNFDRDILIVASKLKKYVKDRRFKYIQLMSWIN